MTKRKSRPSMNWILHSKFAAFGKAQAKKKIVRSVD